MTTSFKMHPRFFAVLLGVGFLAMAGCGKLNRTLAHYRGYAEICVHGVDYLQFSSGASVEYLPNGNLKLCQNN